MKKVIRSKVFIITVGVLLILMLVFFPHVKTTRVNGELTGQNITVKETFLLHRIISIKNTNVCIAGITGRVTEVTYYLDGSVKSAYTESCASDTTFIMYSKSGDLLRAETSDVLATGISKTTIEYNENGQEILNTTSLAQNVTKITTEYDEKATLIKTSTETFNVLGETVLIEFTIYNEDDTEDFKATCESGGLCALEYYITDEFSFIKNDNGDLYTYIKGANTVYDESVGGFFSYEIDSILDNLKQKASD